MVCGVNTDVADGLPKNDWINNMKKILFLFLVFPAMADELTCVPQSDGFYAIFTPNIYNCGTNEFLPANTDGCQPCPTDYSCSGGSFKFNKYRAQGIIFTGRTTHVAIKSCADNFPVNLYAKFVPNKINLDWYSGENVVAQTMCEYDGAIQLPPAPVRPGYTFVGWKLKQ